jgi:Leucine-rich repeat (LRR) protein
MFFSERFFAMAKAGKRDDRQSEYKKFATREPELTVLTDHALRPEQTYRDSFNMRYRLGPVFDIVRYPGTRTPMAIAVYGDWGAGKTTAMKWLHGLIDEWNRSGKAKRKIKIRPVWFYPWKYHSQEDVWRGLVGEVILNSIDVKTASAKTVTEAFKMLGTFVGKSVINLVSAVKIGVPGFELSGESIEKIAEDFKEVAHPEKPYLNPFEDALKEWLKKAIGKNQRMVIFIDDLDRCMPEIALQVLEALKLYLNIEKLIFVVGVDKKVVDKLVKKHYTDLGLDEDKSNNYLAKMFQVEVQVEPSEQQISDFLDEQLKEITYWKEPHLTKDERGLFRGIIFKLAERNPREVKRLINSALMTGAGAMMIRTKTEDNDGIQFNQGLQLFFVRKILDDGYTMGLLIGSDRGNAFFRQWAEIVCGGRKKDKNFPCSIKVPKDFDKLVSGEIRKIAVEVSTEGKPSRRHTEEVGTDLSFAPPEYHLLLKNTRFSGLLHLLGDEDLGELMRIPYPVETAEITAVVGTSKDEDIIREAIARLLGKKPEEVTSDDYNKIEELDLRGSEISDLEPIKQLTSLQELKLMGTDVSDLEPIKQLTSLQELDLMGTKVKDLEPIKKLTNLQSIDLVGTQVSDLEPIKGLTSLQSLDLDHTQVSNLEPIKGLTSLQSLDVSGTQVNDLEPIKQLTKLRRLALRNTQVRDLEPIKGLKSLQELVIVKTQVRDLEPIKQLTRLQWIHLRGTQVSNEQAASLKEALPKLHIAP